MNKKSAGSFLAYYPNNRCWAPKLGGDWAVISLMSFFNDIAGSY